MKKKNLEKEFALSPNPLVRFFYERYVQNNKRNAKSTNDADTSRVRKFLNYLQENNHIEWNAYTVDGFIQYLEDYRFGPNNQRRFTSKTINNYYSVLNSLSREAYRYQLHQLDLMEDVKGKKLLPPKKRKPLALNCVSAVAREGVSICEASSIAFEFHCRIGTRVSEHLAMAWEDVSFINKTITIKRALVSGEFKATKKDSSTRKIELSVYGGRIGMLSGCL